MQRENREVKYFAYNFVTRNTGDILNFFIKLIDNKNKDIAFEKGGKKFPIIEFMIAFL